MPIRRFLSTVKGSPLGRNPKLLPRVGDHVEKQLVLVNLLPGSGADECVSGVHVDCIAAGAPQRHVFLNPHEATNSYEA